MHRNRTWTLDPPEWRTQRNRLLPIEGGDGSTLNLDFTTMSTGADLTAKGLTFNRLSNATFVNSSGYVENAGANTAVRSELLTIASGYNDEACLPTRGTTTSPTGGTAVVLFPTLVAGYHRLQFTFTVTMGARATVSCFVKRVGSTYNAGINSTGFNGVSGLFNLDGNGSVIVSTAGSNATITKVTDDGWFRISVTGNYLAVSSMYVYMDTPSNTTDSTGSGSLIGVDGQGMAMWGFQINPGSLQQYYPTTTAAYYAPRFDYSPTNIGEPRGLLIENTAINLALYSENINPNASPQNIYWFVAGGSGGTAASVTPVSQTDPANGSTASRCILGTSTVGRVYQGFSTTSGETYTMSFWAKSISGNTALHFWHNNSATGNSTAVTVGTSWARYQVTVLARSGGGFVEFGIANLTATAATVDFWGMQIELGSGASSYIPTGPSQVTRNPDYCQSTVASGITNWLTSLTTSTYFVDLVPISQRGAFPNACRTITSTSQGYEFYCYDGTTNVNLTCTTKITASTNVEINIASGLALNSRHKIAYSINATSGLRSINGTTVSAANPIALPTGTPSVFGIGSSGLGSGTAINAWIRGIRYYPTALTQAQINALTAPTYVAPTLDLDFTTMSTGADLTAKGLTFTRLSNATFVNSSGYVDHAGANLLLQGSNLGNATSWFNNGLTSRNPSADPNGLNEAVELNEDATNTVHAVIQVTSQNFNGLVYTSTVYMKSGTNRTIGFMRDNNVSSDATVFYTLTGNGTATIANGAYGIVASINAVGGGWYRCVFTIKGASTANVTIGTAKGTAYGDWSFAGTVGNSIHVWGAQLNPGTTAQTYYPTTTAAYYAPRFDYSPTTIGQSRGLLIEGLAVNAATYSEDFSNAAWTKTNITQTPASGTSPNNSNTATLIAEIAGYAKHSLERSITVTAGSIYTFSVFLKEASSDSRRYVAVQVADGQAAAARNTIVVDLQTGTVTANGVTIGTAGAPTDVAHSITPYRDGWYRVSVTMKHVSSPCYPAVMLSDVSTLVGGVNQPFYTAVSPVKGLLVYGTQLELGSGASSYIPTGASTVQRNAELYSMTGTNFSSWFNNATSGTFLVGFDLGRWNGNLGDQATQLAIGAYGAGTLTMLQSSPQTSTTSISAGIWGTTYNSVSVSTTINPKNNKAALTFNGLNASATLNGVVGATATTTGAVSRLSLFIGSNDTRDRVNGTILSVKYYPTVFTSAQLQELTAL